MHLPSSIPAVPMITASEGQGYQLHVVILYGANVRGNSIKFAKVVSFTSGTLIHILSFAVTKKLTSDVYSKHLKYGV